MEYELINLIKLDPKYTDWKPVKGNIIMKSYYVFIDGTWVIDPKTDLKADTYSLVAQYEAIMAKSEARGTPMRVDDTTPIEEIGKFLGDKASDFLKEYFKKDE